MIFYNSLLIVFIFSLFSPLIAQNDDDEIEWSNDYSLSWDDFKGEIGTSIHDANSAITIRYKDFSWEDNNGTCRVVAVFNRTKSWTKSKRSDILLNHEQGHFNINEIYARLLRKKIESRKFRNKTLTKEFDDIYNSILIELVKYNDIYDKETNFGKNEEKQKEWEMRINKILNKYDKYKECIIKIRIR